MMPDNPHNKKNIILIVDDEPQIRKLLKITLKDEGFGVEEAENGAQAIRMSASVKPDLIILDLGLPDMDGKEVLQNIREWSQVPVIVCSVRDADKEVVAALGMGADDYVTKPFNPDVLIARILANLRKSVTQEAGEPDLENGRIRMDLVRHEVYIDGQNTFLTPKEYELLRYFMVNRGKMITHKQVLKDVWGPAHADDMQYLRVYVSQLREKIEPEPKSPSYVVTEPGVGYRMEVFDS
ncbi:response regulator transcription factor [Sneathiella glossodoripedis]|uniref:response regulator transcription factor n=1 Tax=Sneathiella glossodoripedis TaxID=418853 RepID=UPI00190127BD|nr:response regulator transcription factor [Sneathiella glossodoripedis]